MKWNPAINFPAALLRYNKEELDMFSVADIERELHESATQFRAFSFLLDQSLSTKLSGISSLEEQLELFIPMRNRMIDEASVEEPSVRRRFYSQWLITRRLLTALYIMHRALAEIGNPLLMERRFVLVKERPGSPTIYHISYNTSLLAYLNPGPPEREHPTIYLGLNLLNVVLSGLKEGDETYYRTLIELLKVEERAIETGYTHTETIEPAQEEALNQLLDRIIAVSDVYHSLPTPIAGKAKPFSAAKRKGLLEQLDSRIPGEEGTNFNYEACRNGVLELVKLARKYKTHNDTASLYEVVRLLVAASGHDIHDVRNRANIALERTFSPKEFDAPLATQFETIKSGARHKFSFNLPSSRNGYFLRIYGDRTSNAFIVDGEMDYSDLDLKLNSKTGCYEASRLFRTLGNYDWLLFRAGKSGGHWVDGQSGRINVLPDLDGEIVLEIFPDIHGHTRLYWKTPHPGMVYNEMGQ
ncbi:MAG: hypothetical protein PF450_00095, partial [Bacteroidales bacterium]|nr:hypothetical protein [Bacteroidales bacterium]